MGKFKYKYTTAEVVKAFAEKGYIVDPDWEFEGAKLLVPFWFDGTMHKMSFEVFNRRAKACFKTISDKTSYIKSTIMAEGFGVDVLWVFESAKSFIPIIANGIIHLISWDAWSNPKKKTRPCFQNMAGDTPRRRTARLLKRLSGVG